MSAPGNTYKVISRIVLLAITAVTAFAISFFPNLKFDYDFESFFPTNDPDLEFYLDFREKFEYDNEFVLIAFENKEGIFKQEFLAKVQRVTDSLSRMHHVARVVSPTNIKNTVIAPLGMMEIPFLHITQPERYIADSIDIYRSPDLVGTLFSTDARSVSLFMKTKEGISKMASDTLLFKVEALLGSMHFDGVHIAGKMKAQYVYIEKIKKDFITFFMASFLLVVVFLFISFRSFWGIWIPLLVVLVSMIWMFGLMGAVHKPLDLMMVLLPTMIFIVGMSDVVHIVSKYLEEIRYGHDRLSALRFTLRDVGLPTLLTLIATGIGFLSLLYSSVKPIRDFGIYTSVGVLIAFILAFTMLPALFSLIKIPLPRIKDNNKLFWNKQLHTLLLFVFANRKKIGVGCVVICILSFIGVSKIHVNNNLLEDLVEDDQLKVDFAFFEKNYAGVRPFEMALQVKDASKTLLDKDVLEELNTLENYLQKEHGVGYIISPLTLVKQSNRALNNGYPESYSLPADTAGFNESISLIKKFKKRNELKAILTSDFKEGRITAKMQDLGSARIKILNASLENFTRKNLTLIEYKITGTAALIDTSNEHLIFNMLQGILMSILVVSLIIAMVHRSFKIVIISILPNIIPMLIVGGLMGFAGIELKVSTAIIFSIAFGIATDDTIHFLGRLKLELSKGSSMLYAIKRSYISTGKAVIVTSLILTGGFLTLILSDFQSTFYFGLLVSSILFIAVLTDLLLLPPLLLWLCKSRSRAGIENRKLE